MTALGEEFVDGFGDPDRLPDFPPTFETPTRVRGRKEKWIDSGGVLFFWDGV
jgi:hypothetical protein